jgi:hypothetical protein
MTRYKKSFLDRPWVSSLLILLIFVLITMGPWACYQHGTQSTDEVTIRKAESQRGESGTSYLIYTEDDRTFAMNDAWSLGHFSSSDLYGKIVEGKRYKITYYGERIYFMSLYPNIIKAKEIKQ